MKTKYPAEIIYNKEDRKYFVSFLDFEEAFTEGETVEEALFNTSEVLSLTLKARLEENMQIELPSNRQGKDIYYIGATNEKRNGNEA